MKVFYDSQAFTWEKYAGIPRYFTELITALMKNKGEITCQYPDLLTRNSDYLECLPRSKISPMNKCKVKIADWVYSISKKDVLACGWYSEGIKKSIQFLKYGDFDVFHATHYNPYFLDWIGSKPFVTTIHDITHEKYPEYNPSMLNINNIKKISDKASHIIAVSKNTKKEFTEYYDIDKDKVSVIYLASSYTPEYVSKIPTNQHLTDKPYILVVNKRSGQKNFMTLVIAIAKLLLQYNIDLICIGGQSFSPAEIKLFVDLNILNHVKQYSLNNAELCAAYKAALCFVFPSVAEGFGLPTLDAFACGCPVVLSNVSSLPEIGGDAAIYFYPKDLKSIRDSVEKVITDEKMRENMKNAGYKQLTNFSWDRCAAETKAVYAKLC